MTERIDKIDDAMLFRSLEWLSDNAEKAAKARATRVYMDEWVPTLRARIAKECIDAGMSATAADISARASEAYKKALDDRSLAVEEDEKFRWRKGSVDVLVSAWQTLSANARAINKAL